MINKSVLDLLEKILNFFKREREPYVEDSLGHNHEWDETNREGWVACWVCGEEREIGNPEHWK